MGDLERDAKRKRRRTNIEQTVLTTLATVALAGIVVTAPNAVQLLKYLDLTMPASRDPRLRLSESLSRLKRKGLVEWRQDDGRWRLVLTAKGRQHAIEQAAPVIPVPRRRDGRWRFVMFDIPETQRALRNRIRRMVADMGFYRFQDSVWVHPYDCEEIIMILKTQLATGNKLLYIIADAVEYDAPLRKHFALPTR